VDLLVPDAYDRGAHLFVTDEKKKVEYATPVSHLEDAVSARVVQVVLKQLSEKLDAVRECAGEVLESILRARDLQGPVIPERQALEHSMGVRASGSPDMINWASPTDTFPRVVLLLVTETYHEVPRADQSCINMHFRPL
jgi:hypothetical protein